jgi:type I restriction enzyme M protein
VFFTKGYLTEKTWIYDARSGVPGVTKKSRPLSSAHFAEFEICFGEDSNGRSARDPSQSKSERWRGFHISELKGFGYKLDKLKWLKDDDGEDDGELPEPEEIGAQILERLRAATDQIVKLVAALEDTTPPR